MPTQILKEQWEEQLQAWCLSENVRVEIINTVVKSQWDYDLLIIDEVHRTATETFSKVFNCVHYKNILCLTGTLERLDGKEVYIECHAPVCDRITLQEAEENGWIAPHKEYLVLLDVDLTEYNQLTKTFNSCFAQFGFDFNLAMSCATNIITCRKTAKQMGVAPNTLMGVAQKWMKCMRLRKEFIYNHPKKMEVAKRIMAARSDAKGITFSATIKQAESFGNGYVMHSKKKKKENSEILDKFNASKSGFLHTSKAADEGVDVDGVNLEIVLHTDSSKIRKTQRVGRAVRFQEGKTAEIFTLVLRNTQEVNWFNNSNTSRVITINEEQLEQVLEGKEIQTRERDTVVNTKFRF